MSTSTMAKAVVDGAAIGHYIRRQLFPQKLGRRNERVHVIFCPGMGNGARHENKFYRFWQELNLYYEDWTTFAEGGQVFTEYEAEEAPRQHPAGLPRVKADEQQRLQDLVSQSSAPVLLVGFSAGANLVMRTALKLEEDAICHVKFAVLAMGHGIMVEDRWRSTISRIPGVVLIGENELVASPSISDGTDELWLPDEDGQLVPVPASPGVDGYDFSRLPLALDELSPKHWGSYAGGESSLHQISRVLPRCMALIAADCEHNVAHYAYALRNGGLSHVFGPCPKSSVTCSSRSSERSRCNSI